MPAPAAAPALVVVESVVRPKTDYQAEVYSGVPLEDRYARERGLDKGLVLMVFEKQRRAAYRVPHEKIRKHVRLAPTQAAAPVVVASLRPSAPVRTIAHDRVDVLATDDGIVVVDTTTTSAGIFTTSDVYAFPNGTSPEQRLAMLAPIPPLPRERVRRALEALR